MNYQIDGSGAPERPPTPVFLVLEKDMLIATDIADALRAHGPCRIVHLSDPAEMEMTLAAEPRLSAAILEMKFAQVEEAGLSDSLSSRTNRIVLTLGDTDGQDMLPSGWFMLVRPFTDDMIRELLSPMTRH